MGSLTRPFVAQWVRLTIRVPRRVARRRRANAPFSKFISSFVLSANHFFYFFYFFLLFPFFPSPTILGEKKTRKKEEKKKMIQMIINTQTTATTDYKHFRFPAARVVREIATCGWLVTLRLLQKKKP